MKTRFAVAVVVGAFCILLSKSEAATLAYEGFDYSAGSLDTLNGGFGWGGAWTASATATSAGSISYTGVSTTGIVATASFSSGGTRALDTSGSGNFAAYIDSNGDIGADGTSLWFSLLAADNSSLPRVWRVLRDGAVVAAIGDGAGNSNIWNIASGNVLNGDTPTGVATTPPSFLVGRIDFGTANADTIYFWANPTVASGTPLDSAATTVTGNVAFDTLAWSVGGPSVSYVDEYRFGEDFDSVVTTIPVPEPGTITLLALGAAGLLARRLLRRHGSN